MTGGKYSSSHRGTHIVKDNRTVGDVIKVLNKPKNYHGGQMRTYRALNAKGVRIKQMFQQFPALRELIPKREYRPKYPQTAEDLIKDMDYANLVFKVISSYFNDLVRAALYFVEIDRLVEEIKKVHNIDYEVLTPREFKTSYGTPPLYKNNAYNELRRLKYLIANPKFEDDLVFDLSPFLGIEPDDTYTLGDDTSSTPKRAATSSSNPYNTKRQEEEDENEETEPFEDEDMIIDEY